MAFNPTPTFDSCIYRPGGTAGGDVFTTWADVKTFISGSSNGKCIVYVDDSIVSPALVDAATTVTDCKGRVILKSSLTVGASVLQIEPGATLQDLNTIDGIELRCNSQTATPSLSFTSTDSFLLVQNFGILSNAASATTPAMTVASGFSPSFSFYSGSLINNNSTLAIVSVAAGGSLELFCVNSSSIDTDTVAGSGSLLLAYDASSFDSFFPVPTGDRPSMASLTGSYQVDILDATNPNPGPWSQAQFYIDPQNVSGNASDANAGTSAAAPLLTYNGGVVKKWRTTSPTIQQNTVITFLSSHTDDSDPVVLKPTMVNAVISIQGMLGAAQQIGAGSLAAVVAKNRSTPQLLQANLGTTLAPGTLLHNTTAGKNSWAWVYANVSGTTYTITQPLTPTTVPFGINDAASLSEVDTWATGDTFVAYKPVDVFIAKLDATIAEFVATAGNFPQQIQTYHINVLSPNGVGNNDMFLGNGLTLLETKSDAVISEQGLADDNIWYRINVFVAQGFTSAVPGAASINALGGAYISVIPIEASSFTFDFDVIIAPGGPTGTAVLNSLYSSSAVGFMYIDAGTVGFLGVWNFNEGFDGSATPTTIWGPGAIDIIGTSRVFYGSRHNAVATFLNKGGMTLNAQTSVSGFDPSSGLWKPLLALTPANLDLAIGSGGFGGLAVNVGGSSITSQGTV